MMRVALDSISNAKDCRMSPFQWKRSPGSWPEATESGGKIGRVRGLWALRRAGVVGCKAASGSATGVLWGELWAMMGRMHTKRQRTVVNRHKGFMLGF